MLMPDHEIRRLIKKGLIGIEPFEDDAIQPASYDIRLGYHFRVFKHTHMRYIDLTKPQESLTEVVRCGPEDDFVLHPNEFALACSIEKFYFSPEMAGKLEGRSSLARSGLLIEAAGWFDPGFEGVATMELANVAPASIVLRPGIRIGQMCFFRLPTAAEKPYEGKYKNQEGPIESRLHLEFP